MSLLNKIKSSLGRRHPVQPPVSDLPETSAPDNGRGDSGLKNSVARGAAEGTARETTRKFFEQLLGD